MASRPHPPNHIKNHINPHPSSTAYQGTSVPHPRTHIHPALQCCTHINPRNTHPRQPSTTVLCANQPPPLINRVSGRVSTACQGASAGQPPSPTHPRPPSTALPHQPRIWGRQYLGASVGQPPTPTHPHPPCCTNINPRAHQPRIWGSINTQYGTPSPPHLYPSLPRREHRDRGGLATFEYSQSRAPGACRPQPLARWTLSHLDRPVSVSTAALHSIEAGALTLLVLFAVHPSHPLLCVGSRA